MNAKKIGDWINLYYTNTSGFVTTLDKKNEGWKTLFFVLKRTAGGAWGFHTTWLFGKPAIIRKEALAGRETGVWELCRCYRFHLQDVCGPERLNTLRIVGSEIIVEAMPELLALEIFSGKKVVWFLFPTAEHP